MALLFASSSAHSHDSARAAALSIDAQSTVQRTADVDVDGDGDLDALIDVQNAVGYEQCFVALRDGAQWRGFALTGPGGDNKGRCVGAANGVVVYATLAASGDEANEFRRVSVSVAAVTSTGVRVISSTSLGAPPVNTFERLALSARRTTLTVSAPGVRARTLRTR